ncbi:PLP-dependent transferase [bacterium]|nr:PLP-dependent transferase [bacterium]
MKGDQTKLVHGGDPNPRILGSVVPPIFQSATYEQNEEGGYHDGKYIRMSNTPGHDLLHDKLSLICETESALVTSSGMAAITSALLANLEQGDVLLAENRLYGGTEAFISEDLPRRGVRIERFDGMDPASWGTPPEGAKVLYCEAITNPICRVADFSKLIEWARKHGLFTIIDATFATPILFRPASVGFDLEVHSATKGLNGHGDIAAGLVAGNRKNVEKVRLCLNYLGGHLDAHAGFLLYRGLRTLGLRVERQCENALGLARYLSTHPRVKAVNYPSLESHPDHAHCLEYMDGRGGGVLSMEIEGDAETAQRVCASTRFMANAPSLGGVETLIVRPAASSHASVSPEVRERYGVTEGLIRVACGVEDLEDLVDDIDQALEGSHA